MKRYLLAMTMLALGASGVVWIAIKERADATAAKTGKPPATAIAEPTNDSPAPPSVATTAAAIASESASASGSGSGSAAPNAHTQVGDAGEAAVVDAAVPEGGQAFPALAAYAAWSVVRWGMSVAEVEAALREAGVPVVDATDAKTGPKRLRAKSGAWDATIELGVKGAEQIVVTATNLSKEGADAVVAKTKARAQATKTIQRAERHWKKEGGALASLVTYVDGATATMREEHVRERAPGGGLGFAGLRWGMSTQEVVGQLTAAGYAAHVVKAPATTGLVQCSVPNPPPDCAKKSQADTVPFSKGDVEGTASFNQFGLRQLEVSGPTTDGGAARAKQLESSLGKPASLEASTKTQHVDHARLTSIDVEVIERQPGAGLTVVETYRPK